MDMNKPLSNRYLFFILSFFLVLFWFAYRSSYASDYCIYLEDGRKILVDDYWDENNKIFFEVDGATSSIDKNNVKKIVDTQAYDYRNSKSQTKGLTPDNLLKFESNGGVLYLKNKRKITIRKSWIEGSKVACLVNNSVIYFTPTEIDHIHHNSSKPKLYEQYIKEKAERKKNTDLSNSGDGPIENFSKNGIFYRFIGYSDFFPWCKGSNCPEYAQWYKTKKGNTYYWDPQKKNLSRYSLHAYDEGVLTPQPLKQLNIYVPPEQDFVLNGAYYKFTDYKTFTNPGWNACVIACKTYITESGTRYYWNRYYRELRPFKINNGRAYIPK